MVAKIPYRNFLHCALDSERAQGTRSGKAIACRLPAPNDDYIQMMPSPQLLPCFQVATTFNSTEQQTDALYMLATQQYSIHCWSKVMEMLLGSRGLQQAEVLYVLVLALGEMANIKQHNEME